MRISGTTYRCDECQKEEREESKVLNWVSVRILRDEIAPMRGGTIGDATSVHVNAWQRGHPKRQPMIPKLKLPAIVNKIILRALTQFCARKGNQLQDRADYLFITSYPGTIGHEKAILLSKIAYWWLDTRDELKKAV